MTNRIVYLVPDHAEASGGIRSIYRHVELLVAAGRDAAVWHLDPDFRFDWFDSPAPILRGVELDLDETDLLVVPEVMVTAGPDPAPGCRKVIYNQNHFYTFDNVASRDYPGWGEPVPPVWVPSVASVDVLRRLHGDLSIEHVPYAIDLDLFHPRELASPKIVWMPRKRPRESALLEAMLRADPRFEGVALQPVEGLSERETAVELGTATVFVALGHEEGFGLPVLEALASGSPVVGYPAGGGAELFTAPGAYPMADADVVAIVERVAELIAAPHSAEQRSGQREWVESHYSVDRQLAALTMAIDNAMARPARSGVATHPIARLATEPAEPPAAELQARIDELAERVSELTAHAEGLAAELATERTERRRLEGVATVFESDLERAVRELDRSRREATLLSQELHDLRDERAQLRAATDRLVHFDEVTALLAEYKRDNDRLNNRLDEQIRHLSNTMRDRIEDMERSTSWRVTAPLRRVSTVLRGQRRA
jgi:hypothetical protein